MSKFNSTLTHAILLLKKHRPVFAASLLILTASVAHGQNLNSNGIASTHRGPSAAVVRLLTATRPPQPLVHASSGKVALLFSEPVIPLDRLARPVIGLAGYRFDPLTHMSNAGTLVKRVEIIDAAHTTGGTPQIWQPATGHLLDTIQFSPDGRFLSALRVDNKGPAKLVIFDILNSRERILKVPLNVAWGESPCSWVDDDALVCRVLPEQPGTLPKPRWAPVSIEHTGGPAPTRTYANLLENDYEDALFEYYFSSELAYVNLKGKIRRTPATHGLIYSFEASPKGDLAIVTRLQRPYPRMVKARLFPQTVEVWDLAAGKLLYQSTPSGFGLETGPEQKEEPRRIAWKPGDTATIGYLDQVRDDEGERLYRWLSISPPFDQAPDIIAISARPIDEFGWTSSGTPYYWTSSEEGDTEIVNVVFTEGIREVWNGKVENPSNDAGYSIRINGRKGPILEVDGRIFIAGDGMSANGPRPFLVAFDLISRTTENLFTADPGVLEKVVAILDPKIPTLLTSRETETSPPNIYWRQGDQATALRPFANPYPDLEGVERRVIDYARKDGIQLSGTLYTPAGWSGDEPLPTLIWIYPYEYADREQAEKMDVRAFGFHRVSGPSPLAAVLEGYAILVNPTVPILYEGSDTNDDYLKQLVSSVEAAADCLVDSGVANPAKIAVGGRSYGAFSAANLLIHSKRFATAICMSGAYNRTLTPFGFQREKRSFWEATDLYTSISPFFHANKISKPILLVHGAADPNPGTPPLQAKRFFHALAGEGKTVRYVELPFEGHHYLARENILDAADEMIRWLDRTIGPDAGAQE
jgi:dipeptidyl aminopeptidase/acylaminoacyl peptidase